MGNPKLAHILVPFKKGYKKVSQNRTSKSIATKQNIQNIKQRFTGPLLKQRVFFMELRANPSREQHVTT